MTTGDLCGPVWNSAQEWMSIPFALEQVSDLPSPGLVKLACHLWTKHHHPHWASRLDTDTLDNAAQGSSCLLKSEPYPPLQKVPG